MSSISGIGSGSSLDNQFAQNLIQQSGSTDDTLTENDFLQLVKANPRLAQGLASAEGADSSTTLGQLYQKLDTNGDGSISLSELSTALGTLREKMQGAGQQPPPSSGDSTSSAVSATSTDSDSTADITGSTTVGQLAASGTSSSSSADSSSILALLEKILQEAQQQGYKQDGSSSTSASLSVFQTTA